MAAGGDEGDAPRFLTVHGSHEKSAFQVFKELKDNAELFDVTLQVNSKEIYAHRIVLAACSPYFRAMLTTGFAETFTSKISLQDCDEEAVNLIVDYFYSCELRITQDNIEGLLSVASLFEMPELVQECGAFIQEEIQVDNCLGIQSLATQFSLTNLKSKVDNFVSWNFMELSREEEFVLIPPEQLREIISQDMLHVRGEDDVFEAVMTWYDYDEERISKYEDIMELVRFTCISRRYLEDVVIAEELFFKVPTWKSIVEDALETLSSPLRKQNIQTTLAKPRQSPNVLYLIGELYNDQIQTFDLETCTCSPLLGIKDNVGTAVVVENILYLVIGGGLMVEKYNVKLNNWVRVADGFKESDCVACQGLGRIYVIGGGKRAKYLDLGSKVWVPLPQMSIRRSYHAATALQDKVYVAGGVTPPGEQAVASVECYNAESNKWEAIPPMNSVRFRHELAVLGDCIYAIGGCDKVGSSLKKVEFFDLKTKSWQMVQSLNHPRRDFAAGILQEVMFVFGGGGTTTIEQYNKDADKWTVVGSLSKRWSNFRCVAYPFIQLKQH